MRTKVLAAILCLHICAAAGFGASVTVTVQSTAGPWDPTVNSSYPYGTGEDAPTVVTGDGFDFSAGQLFTITYVSGAVSLSPSYPTNDADGLTQAPFVPANNAPDAGFGVAPSYYVDPSQYPVYYGELIGTFADSGGDIVGMPFAVGDSATVTAPAGATELLLGVNDNLYTDNSGSWQINVSQTSAVPLPSAAYSSSALFACLAIFGIFHKRRHRIRLA
jgi:hypothetical protein